MKQPLISVVLPIYNVEAYIDECLESVINQTIGVENLEVIMVNDCSTDNTGSILDQYAERYRNLKVIHLEQNCGSAGKPRNIGIRRAKGKYIAFLDPDDILPPDAYESLFEICERYDSDFVMGKLTSFNEETGETFEHITFKDYMLDKPYINSHINEVKHFLQVKTAMIVKLIKRELIIKNNIFFIEDMKNGEDKYFDVVLYTKAKKFSYIPKTVYLYRLRTDELNKSLTQQDISTSIRNDIEACLMMKPLLKKEQYEYFQINTFRSLLWRIVDEEFVELPFSEKMHLLKAVVSVVDDYNEHLVKKYLQLEEPFLSLLKKRYFVEALEFGKVLFARRKWYHTAKKLEKDYKIQMNVRRNKWWKKTNKIRRLNTKIMRKIKGASVL